MKCRGIDAADDTKIPKSGQIAEVEMHRLLYN
jgi:hypothetical protein